VSPRLAVTLTPTHLRAILASGWRDVPGRTLDVAWSPEDPDAGITALREQVGGVDSIAVAVGLGLLHVKRVELPPAPDDARERMLALESERFFATPDPVVVALAPAGAVAFAVGAAALESWCAAFERWAPVVRVEAAPIAIARVMGPSASGDFQLEAAEGEHGFLSIRSGVVAAARRIPQAVEASPGAALPTRDGVAPSHLAAWGALLGAEGDERATLASPARRRAGAARRRRRLAVACVAAAAGLTLAAVSADRWRGRTLEALQGEVASRREAAAPGEAALAARARLDAEVALVARQAPARNTVLGALAAISSALPNDAVILSVHAVGRDWQVDGTAASAAALVPVLDRDGRFENVRALSASSRFRDGPRTRETFSIALRVRPRS